MTEAAGPTEVTTPTEVAGSTKANDPERTGPAIADHTTGGSAHPDRVQPAADFRPVRRVGRRRVTDAAPGDPLPGPGRAERARTEPSAADRAADDLDIGWGDASAETNDDLLRRNKPPHWG